jgi:hypothetical protein
MESLERWSYAARADLVGIMLKRFHSAGILPFTPTAGLLGSAVDEITLYETSPGGPRSPLSPFSPCGPGGPTTGGTF